MIMAMMQVRVVRMRMRHRRMVVEMGVGLAGRIIGGKVRGGAGCCARGGARRSSLRHCGNGCAKKCGETDGGDLAGHTSNDDGRASLAW